LPPRFTILDISLLEGLEREFEWGRGQPRHLFPRWEREKYRGGGERERNREGRGRGRLSPRWEREIERGRGEVDHPQCGREINREGRGEVDYP